VKNAAYGIAGKVYAIKTGADAAMNNLTIATTERTGGGLTALSNPIIKCGSIPVKHGDTNIAVKFKKPMPSNDYRLFFQMNGHSCPFVIPESCKSDGGFTAMFTSGHDDSISWLAVEGNDA